jgi:hypothetical protein
MIQCPDCNEVVDLFDVIYIHETPVRMRLTAVCRNNRCDLYDVFLLVRSNGGEYILIPPTSNRGVTSSGAVEKGGN